MSEQKCHNTGCKNPVDPEPVQWLGKIIYYCKEHKAIANRVKEELGF